MEVQKVPSVRNSKMQRNLFNFKKIMSKKGMSPIIFHSEYNITNYLPIYILLGTIHFSIFNI
jgi:hypothetical protein